MQEINVCCPYFRTIRCGNTKEHRHLYCKVSEQAVANSDTLYKCISNEKWLLCTFYKPVKELNYESN